MRPRKRSVVAVLVVAVSLVLFYWQWHEAPRVDAQPHVERQLPSARGELYLGETFEGLPLRTVDPFLYSDCIPGAKKKMPVPCDWVRVADGKVTGADPDQVERARKRLRRVG